MPIILTFIAVAILIASLKYDVPTTTLSYVINCESSFDPKAIGDDGTSFGLVQIHLPDHPDVTVDQAFDPIFAAQFLAKQIKARHGKMWTCYRRYQQDMNSDGIARPME